MLLSNVCSAEVRETRHRSIEQAITDLLSTTLGYNLIHCEEDASKWKAPNTLTPPTVNVVGASIEKNNDTRSSTPNSTRPEALTTRASTPHTIIIRKCGRCNYWNEAGAVFCQNTHHTLFGKKKCSYPLSDNEHGKLRMTTTTTERMKTYWNCCKCMYKNDSSAMHCQRSVKTWCGLVRVKVCEHDCRYCEVCQAWRRKQLLRARPMSQESCHSTRESTRTIGRADSLDPVSGVLCRRHRL